MPPRVSICIPTYEPNEEHLRAALDSLFAQTEREWTALIHDDASAKDVRAIVEPYLENDRISLVRSPKRLGIGGNWNACLKVASAPFVQYLFQDDTWEPDYLANALEVIEADENIGMVATDHEYNFEGEISNKDDYLSVVTKRKEIASGKHNGPEFLKQWIENGLHPNLIGEPTYVLLRKDLIGRFMIDMPQFLDVEMWTRMLQSADWYKITENGGAFRVHPGGASTKNNESGEGIYDRFRCLEKLTKVHGEIGATAKTARNSVIEEMVGKFFKRVKNKKSIPTKGSGSLKKFCLMHPLLILKAIWKHRKSA